ARAEAVSPCFQTGPQFLEVVDLAVEDHLHRAVFIADRLVAAAQVDDRQPPVDEADAGLDPETLGVRSAGGAGATHRPQHGRIDRPGGISKQDACNAAHRARLQVRRTARTPSRWVAKGKSVNTKPVPRSRGFFEDSGVIAKAMPSVGPLFRLRGD